MKRWLGLLKREWFVLRSGLVGFVIVILLTLSLEIAPRIVNPANISSLYESSNYWFLISMLMAIMFYLTSLNESMKEREQWLHSSASIFELMSVKVVSSLMGMFSIMFIVGAYSFYENVYIMKSSISILIIVGSFVILLLNGTFLIAITSLFWAILEVFKTRIGNWAWPITFTFFFVGIYAWSFLYFGIGVREAKEYKPIITSSVRMISEENFMFGGLIPSTALVTTGSLIMYAVFIPIIFISSALLFEKKARL